jgi:hypothetical protein
MFVFLLFNSKCLYGLVCFSSLEWLVDGALSVEIEFVFSTSWRLLPDGLPLGLELHESLRWYFRLTLQCRPCLI